MDLQEWSIFNGVDPGIAASCRLAYVASSHKPVRCHPAGILVTNTEDVYSIRHNEEFNWLGVEADQVKTNEVVKVLSLCGKKIVDINNTNEGFVVLTDEGRVYQWKDGEKPQLVSGSSFESQQVVHVACGYDHCLGLTSKGQIYAWGSNKCGQLGVTIEGTISGPVKILFPNQINVQIQWIACGFGASYVVDIAGKVWYWGLQDWNPTTPAAPSNFQRTPKEIPDFGRVKKVVAGLSHAVALTVQNELYYWGRYFIRSPRTEVPTKICMSDVRDVATRWNLQFIAFERCTDVYVWGLWQNRSYLTPLCSEFSSSDQAFQAADDPSMVRPMVAKVPFLGRSAGAWKELVQDSHLPCTGDVNFKVADEVIPAYKEFLVRRNDYFRSMFENEWKESDKTVGCIEIQGFSASGFKMLIYYLYTDQLMNSNMSLDEVSELLRIADFYQEAELSSTCSDILKRRLTPENACAMYELCAQCNARGLQSQVTEFIARNYTRVVHSDGYADLSNELKTQLARNVVDHPGYKNK